MKNNLYEVNIASKTRDQITTQLLKKFLNNFGVADEEIVEYSDPSSDKLTVYFNSRRKSDLLKAFVDKIGSHNISVYIKNIDNADWQNSWKKGFKAFRLTNKLKVIPAWKKQKNKRSVKGNIYIDTSLAFGTGLHETTKFMAVLIERCAGKFSSFIDVGTGTGILAIIANKSGAKLIDAVEISKDAINIANMNFRSNGVKVNDIILGDILKYKAANKYDFVAANLNTYDLVSFSKKLVSLVLPGKFLAVSGISIENQAIFRECFSKLPLKCLKIEKGKQWMAFLYKKSA